jgi:hypothetical protein
MRRGSFFLAATSAAVVALFAATCAADAAPDSWRSPGYYALNGGVVLALLAGAEGSRLLFAGAGPGPDSAWFPGDLSVRQNHSQDAQNWSNVTLTLALVSPAAASVGRGVNPRFANTELVYGEALSANLFLNTLLKFVARRPRPYTYQLPPGTACETSDCYVSFYSGHASTAFAAAVAGSYLFAESAPDRGSRYAMWGFEMALASATANLRVRGGMHYYSDVLVGAFAGVGLGVLVPILHGEHYRPDALELVSGCGGLIVGTAISQLAPAGPSVGSSAASSWSVAPIAFRGGSGVQLRGAF